MCGWSPRTPPHSYTRPSEKHDPFIYFPYRKLTPFIYYFWKLTPFVYYFSNFTHSYTFWVKKIPHWYAFDVKMIPIHILGGPKSVPNSRRTSVYTFIMEVKNNISYINLSIHLSFNVAFDKVGINKATNIVPSSQVNHIFNCPLHNMCSIEAILYNLFVTSDMPPMLP